MYRAYLKVFLDKILAFIGLVIFFPLILIFAVLIKIFLGSPILFKQIRPGLHGKPFVIYKFRTMKHSYDSERQLLPDRERLTKFGKFLRKFSLDELPELFNVLKGDMSLVGPRPLLMEYLQHYNKEQARRHEVKPGVTGLAQISGRNGISWDEKFKLDTWYVDNISFYLDVKILFLTVFKVLKRTGISQDGHATMKKFMGIEE